MAFPRTKPPPPQLPPPPPSIYYTPLPPQPHDQNYVVLALRHDPATTDIPPWWWRHLRTICVASMIFLATIVYIIWPSEPDVDVVRVRLYRIRIHTRPRVLIDASMFLKIKIQNPDVYSMDYTMLDVALGYRGKMLGHVRSDHGHVRALGLSYVDAELELHGVEVFGDVVPLLEDLAKGTVPLDTVTSVQGRVGLLFFGFPLKAKVSCEVSVNTRNQTIAHQDCYPE